MREDETLRRRGRRRSTEGDGGGGIADGIEDPGVRAGPRARAHEQGDPRPVRGARHRRAQPLVEHRRRPGRSGSPQGGRRGPAPRPHHRRSTRSGAAEPPHAPPCARAGRGPARGRSRGAAPHRGASGPSRRPASHPAARPTVRAASASPPSRRAGPPPRHQWQGQRAAGSRPLPARAGPRTPHSAAPAAPGPHARRRSPARSDRAACRTGPDPASHPAAPDRRPPSRSGDRPRPRRPPHPTATRWTASFGHRQAHPAPAPTHLEHRPGHPSATRCRGPAAACPPVGSAGQPARQRPAPRWRWRVRRAGWSSRRPAAPAPRTGPRCRWPPRRSTRWPPSPPPWRWPASSEP